MQKNYENTSNLNLRRTKSGRRLPKTPESHEDSIDEDIELQTYHHTYHHQPTDDLDDDVRPLAYYGLVTPILRSKRRSNHYPAANL
uniref:Uncharacterized protein n=1 Tax=Rhabditophanes sp. KR3021 TaxID=114890 RepID=A0AC35UCV2_9BILA